MADSGDENETAESTAYCPNCGSAVEANDSYCGQCGADLAEGGSQATEESRRQFRARVRDHVNDGWQIQYDSGNEVSLVKRKYGSVAIHVLLLLFTGGVGNLLYGWYHYEHKAERKVIHADGSTDRTDPQAHSAVTTETTGDSETEDRSLSGYVYGLTLLVISVAIFASGTSPAGLAAGLACLILALLLLPPTRTRIENRHPPTTFGPTTSVDERFVSDTDRPCSVCLDQIDQGVKREYEQSYVVAGIPLYTMERGENWYCESCRHDNKRPENTESLDSDLTTAQSTDSATESDDSATETSSSEDDSISKETPTAATDDTQPPEETELVDDESEP